MERLTNGEAGERRMALLGAAVTDYPQKLRLLAALPRPYS